MNAPTATFLRKPLTAAEVAALFEALQLGPFTMVTTVVQTFDSLLVDTYGAATWELTFLKSDGTRLTRRITAVHNGSSGADATTVSVKGDGVGLSSELTDITVDVSGVGAAQAMRLRATMTYGAGTWKVSVWRLPQKPPQYS